MERYLIQCPFLGVSIRRDSTVLISVPTVTISRIFEENFINENIAIILVTRNNAIRAMRLNEDWK